MLRSSIFWYLYNMDVYHSTIYTMKHTARQRTNMEVKLGPGGSGLVTGRAVGPGTTLLPSMLLKLHTGCQMTLSDQIQIDSDFECVSKELVR